MMKPLTQSVAIVVMACSICAPNIAHSSLASAEFHWLGDGGYKASGTFTYNDTLESISAKGSNYDGGFNNGLDHLDISFYDPFDNLLFNTTNVQDGVVSYEYLQFTFNPGTMAFEDYFDLGAYSEDSEALYYVWGQMGSGDSYLERSDGVTLDSQAIPAITVRPATIPLPNGLALFVTGILSLLGLRKLA
ncbi:hypothetical protein [Methylomonas rapida]|uniref:Uncharacterized protein n=1 Tax=Methylomonas rapida TaxID=2963939 RepID=A0ABY7GIX6_9GAMM|nr:hypothetical protein [Methylomonas rapida]WAR44536.1 hypothetical protein NM686_019645 [Methylomonas rapida]